MREQYWWFTLPTPTPCRISAWRTSPRTHPVWTGSLASCDPMLRQRISSSAAFGKQVRAEPLSFFCSLIWVCWNYQFSYGWFQHRVVRLYDNSKLRVVSLNRCRLHDWLANGKNSAFCLIKTQHVSEIRGRIFSSDGGTVQATPYVIHIMYIDPCELVQKEDTRKSDAVDVQGDIWCSKPSMGVWEQFKIGYDRNDGLLVTFGSFMTFCPCCVHDQLTILPSLAQMRLQHSRRWTNSQGSTRRACRTSDSTLASAESSHPTRTRSQLRRCLWWRDRSTQALSVPTMCCMLPHCTQAISRCSRERPSISRSMSAMKPPSHLTLWTRRTLGFLWLRTSCSSLEFQVRSWRSRSASAPR